MTQHTYKTQSLEEALLDAFPIPMVRGHGNGKRYIEISLRNLPLLISIFAEFGISDKHLSETFLDLKFNLGPYSSGGMKSILLCLDNSPRWQLLRLAPSNWDIWAGKKH